MSNRTPKRIVLGKRRRQMVLACTALTIAFLCMSVFFTLLSGHDISAGQFARWALLGIGALILWLALILIPDGESRVRPRKPAPQTGK